MDMPLSPVYCLINEEGKEVLGNNSYFLTGGSTYSIEPGWIGAYDYTDDSMIEEKYGIGALRQLLWD